MSEKWTKTLFECQFNHLSSTKISFFGETRNAICDIPDLAEVVYVSVVLVMSHSYRHLIEVSLFSI